MEPNRQPKHDEWHEDIPPQLLPGDESKLAVLEITGRSTSEAEKQRIHEGLARHGTPFAAFLLLDDVSAADASVLNQFGDVYSGSWEQIDQLIDDELDALEWKQARQKLRSTPGIDAAFLDWNRDALEQHLREVYSIVELDGWHHVFYR
ncbi:MAG: hypothetical protein ACK5LO_05490 [Leucobacter sp.]